MLYCPTCKKLFLEDGDLCPYDGDELITPPDPRLGKQIGSYLILEIIGKGGMGKVYKAEHVFIGKMFAIKILHPRFMEHTSIVDRFIFEARAAARINHPNIVDITDFGYTDNGLPYFVMEYMVGKELVELIIKESPLPVYRAVNIMIQISDALAACHEEGIVHQDLKPENIFLVKREGRRKLVRLNNNSKNPISTENEDSYDMVKVLDFGVAHLAKLESADTIAGTPEFMAPEQAQGITGDLRSDIYSLGVIFYEMLTKDLPFTGSSPSEVFKSALMDPIPLTSTNFPELRLPREIDRLLEKALAKNPDERYQNLDRFINDLKGCFGNVFYSRDIPIVLKKKEQDKTQIDPLLSKDLSKLFSSKKSNSNKKTIKKGHSVTVEQKNKSIQKTKDESSTPSPDQNRDDHPIDENLAAALKGLFSKKKK
jgi:serine/threonine protein kinase